MAVAIEENNPEMARSALKFLPANVNTGVRCPGGGGGALL